MENPKPPELIAECVLCGRVDKDHKCKRWINLYAALMIIPVALVCFFAFKLYTSLQLPL